MQEEAVKYLKHILDGFVNTPEEVKIESEVNERGLTLKITATKKDTPLLIGQKGSVIRSIRRIMGLYGRKNKATINVYVPKEV